MNKEVFKNKILAVSERYFPAQASFIGKPPMIYEGVPIDISDDPPATITVLVEGDIGDYAAYTGHGSPQWVADHGDKIKFEEACVHFPHALQKEKYRD